jgi:hypothetical protein
MKKHIPIIFIYIIMCFLVYGWSLTKDLKTNQSNLIRIMPVNKQKIEITKTVKLFIIERSKNANIVEYDAQISSNGKIHPEQPIIAYWILLAKDGKTQELSSLDKKAYGFDCFFDSSTGEYQMIIRSFKKRNIKIYENNNTVKAEIIINGKPAYLDRIYIKAKETILLPSVEYIELYGKDKINNSIQYEKINV